MQLDVSRLIEEIREMQLESQIKILGEYFEFLSAKKADLNNSNKPLEELLFIEEVLSKKLENYELLATKRLEQLEQDLKKQEEIAAEKLRKQEKKDAKLFEKIKRKEKRELKKKPDFHRPSSSTNPKKRPKRIKSTHLSITITKNDKKKNDNNNNL